MESILVLLSIVIFSLFVYGYIEREYNYKNIKKCNILYVPMHDKDTNDEMYTHVLDMAQSNFTNPNNIPPRGQSILDDIIPPFNRIYDNVEIVEGR
tara:strand:- start:193 stop:480 length:288 start_codon:yes stop_codon:yes gene_type:complete